MKFDDPRMTGDFAGIKKIAIRSATNHVEALGVEKARAHGEHLLRRSLDSESTYFAACYLETVNKKG